jgi:hypothetical protein
MSSHRLIVKSVITGLAAALTGLALLPTFAAADSVFTDWTAVSGTVAQGTLRGTAVALSGTHVWDPPVSELGGISDFFADPTRFSPALAQTDHLQVSGTSAASYTLTFATPVVNPIIHIASLASTLQFAAGMQIERISGSPNFTVAGSTVNGDTSNNAGGTIRLLTKAGAVGFTATVLQSGLDDGVAVQVGAPAGPQTLIMLDPAEPGADGAYPGAVGIHVAAIDGSGGGGVETRCVLDPPSPPASFSDIPAGCPFLEGGSIDADGDHILYAASRDAFEAVDWPVSRAFRVAGAPETTITAGPTGDTWAPDPVFSFVSSAAGSTFECSVDLSDYVPCAAPYRTRTLPPGEHHFIVRATAPSGLRDHTPAVRTFTVLAPVGQQLSCRVQPVFYGSITLDFSHPDRWGCELRSPDTSASRCAPQYSCQFTNADCPVGARCTLSVRGAWYDADKQINWGLVVGASLDPYIQDGQRSFGSHRKAFDEHDCRTGWSGDRCFAQAKIVVLGDGSPLWASCAAGLYFGMAVPGVSKAGPDAIRRIVCDADLTIEPAAALAITANATIAQVNADVVGSMTLLASIRLPSRTLARAARRATPRIARATVRVNEPGPVTVPLKLNKAAKRLLKRRGRLAVQLRATLTPDAGQPLTRTARVTLRRVAVGARRHRRGT